MDYTVHGILQPEYWSGWVCVLVAQSCPTLCDPMDSNPPCSSVHEIFRARILEWVAISFSRGSSQPRDRTQVSCTAGKFFTNWATREAPLSLFQRLFPTQRSNSDLPRCRQILYQLSHKGSPRILEWVAYPFSSRSSPPRNRTRVSCIAGGFFTDWAKIDELQKYSAKWKKQDTKNLYILGFYL